ncbi:MAG: nucleotidyltransferase family protein [Firmicutes bacterium]|nr:nucleotidyltransferase family protein [Candidatus Colimorpha enterica]
MNVGIVCEYNPLHVGHRHQYEIIRQKFGADTRIVCVMSGNFVQRGEPAVFDKFTRAGAAVRCGADLVLELIPPFSLLPADRYALSSVSVLDSLGCIDVVCFGSECGDVSLLRDFVRKRELLPQVKDASASYQKSAERLFSEKYPGSFYPKKPNNILAAEYLSALDVLGSGIVPFTYTRSHSVSAEKIREKLSAGEDFAHLIPQEARLLFSEAPVCRNDVYSSMAMYSLLTEGGSAFGMNGGVYERIKHISEDCRDIQSVISRSVCGRYSASRISRSVLCSVLGIKDGCQNRLPLYANLLAADYEGRKIVAAAKKSGFPILTKHSDSLSLTGEASEQYCAASKNDMLYSLMLGKEPSYFLKQKPFITD